MVFLRQIKLASLGGNDHWIQQLYQPDFTSSQNMFPGSAAAASGNLLEMQMTNGLHPRPTENKAWQSVF